MLRFFMTNQDYSPVPLFDFSDKPTSSCDSDVDGGCNRWVTVEEAASNDSAYLLSFSAECFMTVRNVIAAGEFDDKNLRPMALIQAAWGGTRVEAWSGYMYICIYI